MKGLIFVHTCAVIVAGGEVSQGGGYQQYLKGSADDYQQYVSQSAGSSQGSEYYKYMADYAGEYQRYMNHNTGGGASSADYQKYMKDYGGDYQKYLLHSSKEATGVSRSGSGYQAYMQTFAADYQQHMRQSGSDGGAYENYMKAYASEYQRYMAQSNRPAGNGQQTVHAQPAQLLAAANSLDAEYETKQSDASGDSWKEAFKHKYAKEYSSFKSAQERLSKQFKDVPSEASDCETLQQLDEWLEAETARIDFYVPKEYSSKALHNLQDEYAKRAAQIIEGKSQDHGASDDKADKKDKTEGTDDTKKEGPSSQKAPSKDVGKEGSKGAPAKGAPAPKQAKGSDDGKAGSSGSDNTGKTDKKENPTDGKKSGGGLFGGLFGGGVLAADNPARPAEAMPVGAAVLASIGLLSLITMIVQRRRALSSRSDTALHASLLEEP